MHRGKKFGLAIAAAAVAALVTGTVSQASVSDTQDLRGLLTPAKASAAGHLIDSEVSLQELSLSAAQLPWGMAWAPDACANYLEIAVPNLYESEGFVRSTDRTSPSFSHDNFYLDMVARADGADLNKIRDAALLCNNGTLTLDGIVTGTVNIREVATSNANTLGLAISISFPAATDAKTAAIMAKYGYGAGARVVIEKVAQSGINDGVLFSVMSPSAAVAEGAIAAFMAK